MVRTDSNDVYSWYGYGGTNWAFQAGYQCIEIFTAYDTIYCLASHGKTAVPLSDTTSPNIHAFYYGDFTDSLISEITGYSGYFWLKDRNGQIFKATRDDVVNLEY